MITKLVIYKNLATIYTDEEEYTFTYVKGKKAEKLYNGYKNSINFYGQRFLDSCYTKASTEKKQANRVCRGILIDLYGEKSTIISFNTYSFTYGFLFNYNNKKYYVEITKNNRYLIEIK